MKYRIPFEKPGKNQLLNNLRYILCGIFIGAGAILPGISGGVLAVIFGVYRPFMELLAHPKTALPKYRAILIPLGIGWTAGFFGIAKGLTAVLNLSASVTIWLLAGLIAGTVPALYRTAGRQGRPPAAWWSFFLCLGGVSATLYYVRHILHYTAEPNFLWYTFCGVLWGLSFVIPGLTSSSVMIALGLYQPMLESLSRLEIPVFAACLPGMGLTVLLSARLMSWMFRKYNSAVLHGILGIIAASTASILPLHTVSPQETVLCGVCFTGGFALACLMGHFDRYLETSGNAQQIELSNDAQQIDRTEQIEPSDGAGSEASDSTEQIEPSDSAQQIDGAQQIEPSDSAQQIDHTEQT